MVYYSNGFAWRKAGDWYGVLECAPIEDAADEAAWCEVAGFNAEPEIQAQIEAVRDALFAAWLQNDAALLSAWGREQRDLGNDAYACSAAYSCERMTAKARELMGVA